MDDDEKLKAEFLKQFDDVAKAAAEIAARAKKVQDTDLASTQYINLSDELCTKVHGLERLARKLDCIETGYPACW